MVEKLSVKQKPILRGEAALAVAVIVNTFGVVLMLYSESGISAISSVPFAFSLVLPQLTLGTWTYDTQKTKRKEENNYEQSYMFSRMLYPGKRRIKEIG